MQENDEQLEEKLRRLGYLNNPIDAFVAAEEPGDSLLGRIVAVGGRSALLAGPLLGALTTVESALLLPGLLHRPQDLAVFGLYQIAIYTAAFFVLGILWAGAVALIFRLKPRPVGHPVLLRRTFEMIGGLAIFFYLALWWNSRAGGVDAPRLLATVLATGIFAALSFWLGRYLGLLAYLVVMRLRPETPVPPMRRHSARFVLAAGIGCVGLLSLSLALTEPGGGRLSAEGAELSVPMERRGVRLVLIGVDGLSAELYAALLRTGSYPELQRLWAEGARASIAVERASPIPPVVWTTLTTGIRPRGHGVRDFDTRILYGVSQPLGSRGPELGLFEALQNLLPALHVLDRLPLSSAERQSKALWELLAEAGLKAAGVNWWASWPAGAGPAIVVSDRVYTRLHAPAPDPVTVPEGETAPPELLARLADLRSCCPLPQGIGGLVEQTFGARALQAVATAYESDRFMREAALLVLREHRPAFLALYQRQLDVTLRATAKPAHGPLLAATALGPLGTVAFHELDRHVAELRAELGPAAAIALVGLPSAIELEPEPGLRGIFLWLGPLVRPSGAAEPRLIEVEDVVPTLLAYYGLPLSEELAGGPASELFEPGLLAGYPLRSVPSYGARREALEGQRRSSYDERQIEMMRSLGYIE
jgi:hypothetical protein